MAMVQITLNGIRKEVAENITLKDLLSQMDLPKFFVVEKNMKIVYKENFETELIKNGDSIEIATFCGGG